MSGDHRCAVICCRQTGISKTRFSVPGFSCKGLFQGENGTKTQRLSQDQGQCDSTDQTHAPGFVVALN